ncbi:uncharacterized protein E0L32_007028 [Thyridium curvatum]|uniref:Uncharacterized protein n=1 Tax=Thyridium curvatum TaxID=1093900 RepID=A0A507B5S1_9PEZI|nr:uncharacterized protein E0L32_007028 [Thyridium curvatum]TPX12381.1 hypothetical protein E0L32_007028 [Thyridium curvatum]
MANLSIVVPCAVLGSICAAMLAFIWWWFPRTWNKGSNQESEEINMQFGSSENDGDGLTQKERRQIAGQRAREYLEAIDARNKARAEGREVEGPAPIYFGFERGTPGAAPQTTVAA